MATQTRYALCRACHVGCGLVIQVEDGRAIKVHGDKENPVTHGFTCMKGREIASYHGLSTRLLGSLKRDPSLGWRPIASHDAIDEVADRIGDIISRYGPRAVAFYIGTLGFQNIPAHMLTCGLQQALKTPMFFTSYTIDQPGKAIADALHGFWLAGHTAVADWDRLILVGTNPLISMNGGLGPNPALRLHEAKKRGMKLIVIDPRRTESAEKADLHLAVLPGNDAAVLAAIAHVILSEGLYDADFVAREAVGFAELQKAVELYAPERVATRAGVSAQEIVEAARMFASGTNGAVSVGTGPNMAGRGNLIEYLARVLTTLQGYWRRAGQTLTNSGVMMQRFPAIAGTYGPYAAFDVGERMRVRDLSESIAGMPTAALADEILQEGDGQVRALIVLGGNPIAAFPDQIKVRKALESLDLLVTVDPHMSGTARLSDYVIAPKIALECLVTTMANEWFGLFGPGWGFDDPHAQCSEPVLEVPEGSDLVEDWEVPFGIARRLGLNIMVKDLAKVPPGSGDEAGTLLDTNRKPTSADLWAMVSKSAPVPFEVVRRTAQRGRIFPQPTPVVTARPGDWEGRLDIGNTTMMAELAELAAEVGQGANCQPGYDYRVISRRMRDVMNSCWHEAPVIRKRAPHNPAYMNPLDIEREGLVSGDTIRIESRRAHIVAAVQAEPGVRRGCISMAHAWGGAMPEEADDINDGANTGRLIADDENFDRYSGIPRMSGIPVRISRCAATSPSEGEHSSVDR